jgi:signal transduction histidine kinase
VKFSPASARIRLGLHAAQAGLWRIAVHDTGPGFTEADRAKLFQPFATRSAQPTARETSFGLGLAAAQKLARALGTEIRAENEPTGGAVFQFDFPAA